MNQVQKTAYIPLYAKYYCSQRGIILHDKKSEEIFAKENPDLSKKSKSKYLAYFLAMRASVFDDWTKKQISQNPQSVVIQIGCGFDSRAFRLGKIQNQWFDIDFPEMIEKRQKFYSNSPNYQMIASDIADFRWLKNISAKSAIVILEGVSMYLSPEILEQLLGNLSANFSQISLLIDCYSGFSAKMSKFKNPANNFGKIKFYGVENPKNLERHQLKFIKKTSITPKSYISELRGIEKYIFKFLYAGKFSQKLYRIFEFKK